MGRKLTIEDIEERVTFVSKGTLKLAEGQKYVCKDSVMEFVHTCGAKFKRTVGNIIHNKTISCPVCNPSSFNRTRESLESKLAVHGIELLDAPSGYGDRSMIKVKLPCGCIYNRHTGNTVANGVRCPNHSEGYKSWKAVEDVKKELAGFPFGSYKFASTFINASKRAKFECLKCGHITEEKFQTLKNRGGKCKNCFGSAKSVYEEYLAILLNDLGITFIREYFVQGYFYDFYLPDYNMFIEYDGEQHYKENGTNLFATMNRDAEKDILAESLGKSILRISYKDSIVKSVLSVLEGSTIIPEGSTLK